MRTFRAAFAVSMIAAVALHSQARAEGTTHAEFRAARKDFRKALKSASPWIRSGYRVDFAKTAFAGLTLSASGAALPTIIAAAAGGSHGLVAGAATAGAVVGALYGSVGQPSLLGAVGRSNAAQAMWLRGRITSARADGWAKAGVIVEPWRGGMAPEAAAKLSDRELRRRIVSAPASE